MSRPLNWSNLVSMWQSLWQTEPGLFQKRRTLTQIRRLGPKQPNTWEPRKPQGRNLVRLVETPRSDALALLKASAANTVIPMPQARDRVSVPSLMWSLPLQMIMPVLLCLPAPAPLRLLPHMRPLPLQRPAPLRVLSLVQTNLRRFHLDICPQALCRGSRFHVFPLLWKGMRLCHFLPLFQCSHMLEQVPRHFPRLK